MVLLIGATNRPSELDDAAQRRFRKKLYIPLPDSNARKQIIKKQLVENLNDLSATQLDEIAQKTEGYSGSDMSNLIAEASLGPIRDIPIEKMRTTAISDVRAIAYADFVEALSHVRASVSASDLESYKSYERTHGSLK